MKVMEIDPRRLMGLIKPTDRPKITKLESGLSPNEIIRVTGVFSVKVGENASQTIRLTPGEKRAISFGDKELHFRLDGITYPSTDGVSRAVFRLVGSQEMKKLAMLEKKSQLVRLDGEDIIIHFERTELSGQPATP